MYHELSETTEPSPASLWVRLGLGLTQGLALYGLQQATQHKTWPTTEPVLNGVLFALAVFAPFVVYSGVTAMRRTSLAAWFAAAAAAIGAVAAHDVARSAEAGARTLMDGPAFLPLAATLFVAHHLVLAADRDRKPVARYPTYFDATWKSGIQLALSGMFVGAYWAALLIGAALFKLIGIDAIESLIKEEWFSIPSTAVVFAGAVHLTDVRSGLIRGIRTVALTLLSWLTPLMAVIAVAFLASLPFTGLAALWATKSAAAVLLGAVAALVLLINAVYQDGEPDRPPAAILRHTVRATALTLPILTGIATYALWLRIGQHGLTPERVIGMACVLVAACHSMGYAAAAVLPGPWMKRLELTNVAAAVVAVGLFLALFTPLADPARISVADQLSRLRDGKVAADKFDYVFLRFHGARYGMEALEAMRDGKDGWTSPDIAKRAREALALESEYEARAQRGPIDAKSLAKVTVYPKGRSLPGSFLTQRWPSSERLPGCFRGEEACDVFLMDLNDDGADEILAKEHGRLVMFTLDRGSWSRQGFVSLACPAVLEGFKAGEARVAPSMWSDVVVAGRRLRLHPDFEAACPEIPGAFSSPGER